MGNVLRSQEMMQTIIKKKISNKMFLIIYKIELYNTI